MISIRPLSSGRSIPALLLAAGVASLGFGCRQAPTPPVPPGPGPAAVVAAMNQGVALMGQYDYLGAAKAFEEVLELEPGLADGRVNLAIALFNLGRKEDRDLDRAGDLLDDVLAEDPDHLRALYFRGIVLQHLGEAESAVPLFERVVEHRPRDGAAWYLLGLCRQRIGQPAEADFLKAVECRPYLYSAYYRLFQLAQLRGDKPAAQQHLERFKTLRESPLGESIELPQYNAMGELALVQPVGRAPADAIARSRYTPGAWQPLFAPATTGAATAPGLSPDAPGGGVAAGDLNQDGYQDLVILPPAGAEPGSPQVLLGQPDGSFQPAAFPALARFQGVRSVALGDVDHDGQLDLFLAGDQGAALLRGSPQAHGLEPVEVAPAFSAPHPRAQALLFDADHDGDLDLLIAAAAGCQLWNNNSDGTFTDLTDSSGLGAGTAHAVAILPGDVDGDRDFDLVVLRRGQPARLFLNELLGSYREVELADNQVRGDLGGVLQDFDGDGLLDLLVLGGDPARLALYRGDGDGRFEPTPAFASIAAAAATWGTPHALRVADVDLDGDLDVLLLANEGHLLLNDGRGRFVLQPQAWRLPDGAVPNAWEVLDVNGDRIPDLLAIGTGPNPAVWMAPGQLSVPSTAVALAPTGTRGRDGRTRSPASGYGVRLNTRAGLQEQEFLYTGLNGGPNQSALPVVMGLDGVPKADYVRLLWPDGVLQVELGLTDGPVHTISELERKISSCPVLFSWNGERMEFITDFAGIGGLGYFVAPGEYGQPQVLEHVKLEPDQLRPRHGAYELSVCEPMEESAYVDRVELRAVDHPAGWMVFPDERAVAGGPPPTRDLLVIEQPLFPVAARDPQGRDCLPQLLERDRQYAYPPPLDRRFIGFCEEHVLELDFGSQLASLDPEDRVFLFVAGFIEYPYSQTVYAASQAGVQWQAIRVDRQEPDGRWVTLIPDGGWPGGMGRMFTLDLTGQVWSDHTRLRLVTNLEIYYDQVFVGHHAGLDRVQTHTAPLMQATLQRLGFPREYSPDGRLPLIYDYHWLDASAPFHVLRGAYTRYGPVEELLQQADNRFVILGPGDEIFLRFDAESIPSVPEGKTRSFLFVSHTYCKDMDLYSGASQTLEPLPFHGMSRYPYPPDESFPDTELHRTYQETYNTRWID
jgi:hypothetical protein